MNDRKDFLETSYVIITYFWVLIYIIIRYFVMELMKLHLLKGTNYFLMIKTLDLEKSKSVEEVSLKLWMRSKIIQVL